MHLERNKNSVNSTGITCKLELRRRIDCASRTTKAICRHNVRSPSDRWANKKPAADGSARAFDSSFDDDLIHPSRPTRQEQFRYFRNVSQPGKSAVGRGLPDTASRRKQLHEPVFPVRCCLLRYVENWWLDSIEGHRLAAHEPKEWRVGLGRTS